MKTTPNLFSGRDASSEETGQRRSITIHRAEAYFVSADKLPAEAIHDARERFHYRFFKERSCNSCKYRKGRDDAQSFNENCVPCDSYEGERRLAKLVRHPEAGRLMLSLPHGAPEKTREFLNDYGYTDFRVVRHYPEPTPYVHQVKLKATPREWQAEAIEVMLVKKKGVIKAPARSGKTFLAAAFSVRVGLKTLVLASQIDWLYQFRSTFVGSATDPAMTTMKPERIGVCKTRADFDKYDVCLCTFASFYSEKGLALLAEVAHLFNVLFTDEVHKAPAMCASKVLAHFNTEYRFGLTGTPARKTEGLYEVVEDLMGPVIYVAKVKYMRPTVELRSTGITYDFDSIQAYTEAGKFPAYVAMVENDKARNAKIAAWAYEMYQRGHTVAIPFSRTKAIDRVIYLINRLAGTAIAVSFDGRLKDTKRNNMREKRKQQLITGEYKIVVGNIALLSTGLNIPPLSCLFECSMSSNLTNCEQRTARVLTPMEGKMQPVIVYVMDDDNVQRACRKNEWMNCVLPTFNPQITTKVQAELEAWFRVLDAHREEKSAERRNKAAKLAGGEYQSARSF